MSSTGPQSPHSFSESFYQVQAAYFGAKNLKLLNYPELNYNLKILRGTLGNGLEDECVSRSKKKINTKLLTIFGLNEIEDYFQKLEKELDVLYSDFENRTLGL